MRTNTKTKPVPNFTHEGAVATNINPVQQLRRSVMSCMLYEGEFYEDGISIAQRIADLSKNIPAEKLAAIAIEARTQMHLRHVPLLLVAELAKNARGTKLVGETLAAVIQRPDELAEFLAIYAKQNGVTTGKLKPVLSNQVRKGLAAAFRKFSAYSLAKYNRDADVKLRDVLFLSHAKPKDAEQKATWEQLINGTLAAPDTWEVNLSAGADKKGTFERLIKEGNLGYLALLRNLRNMEAAGVDRNLVRDAIIARENGADKVLPFRFIAAARAAMVYESALDIAMQASIASLPQLRGTTVVLVDVSGSMNQKLSGKSDLTRMDAAAALASIINSDYLRVFSFSYDIQEVPARRGMAGVDAIIRSQPHGGTALIEAVAKVNAKVKYDRIIVITDEQANGIGWGTPKLSAPNAGAVGYVINVASAKNGIGYGPWTHLDGFSEKVIQWIHEYENVD